MDWVKRATAVATASIGVAPSRTFNDICAYLVFGRYESELSDDEADAVDAVAVEFEEMARRAGRLGLGAASVHESAGDSAYLAWVAGGGASTVLNAFNAILVANEADPLPGCPETFKWAEAALASPGIENTSGDFDMFYILVPLAHSCGLRACGDFLLRG